MPVNTIAAHDQTDRTGNQPRGLPSTIRSRHLRSVTTSWDEAMDLITGLHAMALFWNLMLNHNSLDISRVYVEPMGSVDEI